MQSDSKAIVTQFNLNTNAITQTNPVNLNAKLHLNIPDSGLDFDLSTDLVVSHLLSDPGIIVEFNEFEVKGKMTSDSQIPVEISLNNSGSINLEKDTLNFPEVILSLGDAKITTNVVAKNISKPNNQTWGTYQLNAFDLNEFLKKLTGTYFVTNDSFSDFKSSGSWSMGSNHLNLSDLKINFSDVVVTGDADIKQ